MRRDRSTEHVYRCGTLDANACGAISVVAGPLEKLVMQRAMELGDVPDVRATIEDPTDAELNEIDARLKELAEFEDEILGKRRKKLITAQAFGRELRQLSDERTKLERERSKLLKSAGGVPTLTLEQWHVLSMKVFEEAREESVEIWRALISATFDRIEVRGGWRGKRFSPDRVVLTLRS